MRLTIDTESEPVFLIDGARCELHPGQREVWVSEYRILAVFAGWQSGKTVIGPYWLRREIQRRGAGDYAVIAPHNPMLENKALPELKKIFKLPYWKWNGADNVFTLTEAGQITLWGEKQEEETRVLLRHAMNADAIEAFTAKGIWVDEPGQIADAIWEAIQARALYYQARILLTSRPYEHNWYVRDIWGRCMVQSGDRWIRRADAPADTWIVNFTTRHNPNPGNALEYDKQKGLLPPWKFSMKYDGIPTRPAGQIYDCYDPVYNECPRFKIPEYWNLLYGGDFGPDNTAGVLVAEEENENGIKTGRRYVFATYHAGAEPGADEKDTAAAHIRNLRALCRSAVDGEPMMPRAYGGSQQEAGWRGFWTLAGLPISKPSDGNVEYQIECIWAAMKRRIEGGMFPGKAQLVFFDDLAAIITDIGVYTRELDDMGERTEKIANKAKFHRLDGLRSLGPDIFAMPITRSEPKLHRRNTLERQKKTDLERLERLMFKGKL